MKKIKYFFFLLFNFTGFTQININSLPDNYKPKLMSNFKEPLELFYLFINENKMVNCFSIIIDEYGYIIYDKISFYDKRNNPLSKDNYIFFIREISKLKFHNPYKGKVIMYFYTKV